MWIIQAACAACSCPKALIWLKVIPHFRFISILDCLGVQNELCYYHLISLREQCYLHLWWYFSFCSLDQRFEKVWQKHNKQTKTFALYYVHLKCFYNALWAKLLRKWEIGKSTKITTYFRPHFHFHFLICLVFPGIPFVKILKKYLDISNIVFTMKGVRSKKVILRFF